MDKIASGRRKESMRINSQDQTIKKNYIQKYRFLIREYEEVKAGKHASNSDGSMCWLQISREIFGASITVSVRSIFTVT